ncbi:RNA-directed DNA polymerase, eukaryota [Tanacetum coccineum]
MKDVDLRMRYVSNSNPIDMLNSVENDVDLGTNDGTLNRAYIIDGKNTLVNTKGENFEKANSSGDVLFRDDDSAVFPLQLGILAPCTFRSLTSTSKAKSSRYGATITLPDNGMNTYDWDAQLAFWNDPRNQARAAQNRQNRAKSTVVCRQGSRSLARLRDQMMESSSTREYLSLIHTFFVTHTIGGDEMLRLQRLGSNTETGVPYTKEEIMAIVRKGKQRGHHPRVGRILSGRATGGCPPPPQSTIDPADVEKLKKSNKSLTKQVKMMMRLFRSDDKFSQMLDQFESSPEFRGASG